LEKQFKSHEPKKQPYKERLIKSIEDCFGDRKSLTKSAFIQALSKKGIYTLFRQNEEGRIYGVTFVDNVGKVVFNGSDLGKAYGAKAITERLTALSAPDPSIQRTDSVPSTTSNKDQTDTGIAQTIKDLVEAKPNDFTSPDAAIQRRRRKRKRGRSI
jgi:hypothetical protein